MGGVARRATFVKQVRAEGNVLLLDAGDSLVGDEDPARGTRGASSVDFMNRMGYDAMAVGANDLLLKRDVMAQRRAEAQFPFLSANVVFTDSGELAFEPYIVKDVGGVRVGVLALTDFWNIGLDGMQVTDALSATTRFVPELRDRSDLVVVLSRVGLSEAQRIAAAVPGIALVIAGGPYPMTLEPVAVEGTNTVVVQGEQPSRGHAGLYVGMFKLTLDSDKKLVEYKWRVKSMDPEIADDAEMVERVAYWRRKALEGN